MASEFDKWSKEWCQGLLHDGHDSTRVAHLAAKAAWDAAWNSIKDRKGYLNEQGVFVKEG